MAALAARQYGVVTREQLNGLGYSAEAIDRAVASGRLHAWHRSVFAVGHQRLSPHALCMAAVLFRGCGALIGYQSAVWLWGLERRLEIPVHVSPPPREDDIAETERLPVTGVARTLLDYAAEASPFRLGRAIDQADRLGLLDLAAVDLITEEVRGHRGRAPLLKATTIYGEKGFATSATSRSTLTGPHRLVRSIGS